MKILISFPAGNTAPWLAGLQALLPTAEIALWQPGMAATAEYAVVWAPTQQFVDEQPQLRAIFNIGAGVDAILALAIPSSMAVVRLEEAGMAVQMAEYVCQAVIRHFRELDRYEAAMAQGQWDYRKPRRRADFPVGIMGMGVLGARVAEALLPFEFAVNGWSRTAHSVPGVTGFAGTEELPEFLAQTRILVNLLPLTPATLGILNADVLGQLQPGGYLINVARGGHLVEADLLRLLDSGHLAGATLDVFLEEPLPPSHPFWQHPEITLTPHTAARTLREETLAQIAAKIQALSAGQAISGIVDKVRGY